MSFPEVGKKAPSFSGKISHSQFIQPKDLIGKFVVLYFYPKDDTPGCTKEAHQFNAFLKEFDKLNTVILGISRDSVISHQKFKLKYELAFDLISDEDEKICKAYDVIKMKQMYGKQVRGIERSTFLINPDGKIAAVWRKVKVEQHVETVLTTIKNLHDK